MAKKAKSPTIVMTDDKRYIQDDLEDLLGYEKSARSDSDNARNIRAADSGVAVASARGGLSRARKRDYEKVGGVCDFGDNS